MAWAKEKALPTCSGWGGIFKSSGSCFGCLQKFAPPVRHEIIKPFRRWKLVKRSHRGFVRIRRADHKLGNGPITATSGHSLHRHARGRGNKPECKTNGKNQRQQPAASCIVGPDRLFAEVVTFALLGSFHSRVAHQFLARSRHTCNAFRTISSCESSGNWWVRISNATSLLG